MSRRDKRRASVAPSPAGRLQQVQDLLAPTDPETGEVGEPLISKESAGALMSLADIDGERRAISGADDALRLVANAPEPMRAHDFGWVPAKLVIFTQFIRPPWGSKQADAYGAPHWSVSRKGDTFRITATGPSPNVGESFYCNAPAAWF